MKEFIPLSVPHLRGRELEYVSQAVETEWVSSGGPFVNQLEENIAKYVKATGAVSCQNGTSAIHISLLVCGVTNNDEVIVPSLTFIATVNPVKYIGAEPVFMDCDDSLCIDPEKLLQFCQEECTLNNDGNLCNKRTKRLIKAVIVVHVFGNMANMERIMEIAKLYNLTVIEDAAEAIGTYYTEGLYSGKYAGTIGTIGVYSFNGNKIITTGGGGMIVSDDEELLRKAKHLTIQAKSDELYYTHDEIGYNYRMTNLQAALGLAQLEQLEEFIRIKRKNYILYKEGIERVAGLSIMNFREDIRSNYWFYSLFCHVEYAMNRDQIIAYLSSKRIQVRPIWGLICEQKPYLGSQRYHIEKAKFYVDHIVNLPCSSSLREEDVLHVVKCLEHPEEMV